MNEGKRLIFPGLRSRLSHSRESARNIYIYIYIYIYREREREREKEREKERKKERKKKKTQGPSSDGAKVF